MCIGDQGTPSSTVSTATSSSAAAPTTTEPTTFPTSTSTSLLPSSTCDGMASIGATLPADYREAAFDRYGPLDAAPSMTIKFGHDLVTGPVGVRATRIEGGVLTGASRSPNSPSGAGDQVPFVAVNHDGTARSGQRGPRPNSGRPTQSSRSSPPTCPRTGTASWSSRWPPVQSNRPSPPRCRRLVSTPMASPTSESPTSPSDSRCWPTTSTPFNRTVRVGGLVLVVRDGQVQVLYPRGTGGDPRTVLVP